MPPRARIGRSVRRSRHHHKFYRFEALEARRLLACQVFLDQDGTLVVIGDETANQIEIVGTANGVQVTCDGHDHGTFAGLDAIELRAGDGDDAATIDNRNGLLGAIAIKVFGQAGNDLVLPFALDSSFLSDFFPALPALGIDGGEGLDAIEVLGGPGDEQYDIGSNSDSAFQIEIHQTDSQATPVSLDATNVESTKVRAGDGADDVDVTFPLPADFTILGEAGNDFLQLRFSLFEDDGTTVRPVQHFDFKEAADLGDGKDRVTMQGADEDESFEVMGVPDAAVPDPHIRITDLNTKLAPFDGLIVGAEEIDIATAGGKDQFTMYDTRGSLGGIDFKVDTGDDDDLVDVEINTGLQPPSDNPKVPGSGLDPTFSQDPLLTFRLSLNTGAGGDTAFFKSVGGLKYDTEVVDYQAGGGNDKIDFQVNSPRDSASLKYAISPGAGDDEVLLAFEHGDVRHPYVLGALWNDADATPQSGDQTGGQLSLDILADGGQLAVGLGLVGTAGSDTVDVNIAGACNEQKLDISTGDADDVVAVRVVNPAPSHGGEDPEEPATVRRNAPTSINTGDGDDKVKFEETGVVVGDGGRVDWSFVGATGDDEFDLRVANAQARAQATWNWTTDTGADNDLLKVHLFEIDLGPGSLTDWRFLTGEGGDSIDFVRCFMDIGPGSTYGWTLGSGGGDDIVAVMILDVNFGAGTKASYAWDLGPGKNQVTGDISGLVIEQGAALNWSLAGGDESDAIKLLLNELVMQPGGSSNVTIASRGDNDVVEITARGRLDVELHTDLGQADDEFLFDALQGLQATAIPSNPCIVVEAGGGNDSVTFSVGGQIPANLEIEASLGEGDDSYLLDAQQGWQAAAIPDAPCLIVESGGGNDSVAMRFGGPVSANLKIEASLGDGDDSYMLDALQGWQSAAIPGSPCGIVEAGGGNDSIAMRFGGPISANLEIEVSLGDGNNSFLLESQGWNATPDPQNPALQPSVKVVGGAQRDTMFARLGTVSGNFQVTFDGGEGSDIVAADLVFAQLGLGMIDIALAGGGGNDLLTLPALGQSNREQTRLVIDGGAGFDIALGTANVDAFNCEVVIGARRRR